MILILIIIIIESLSERDFGDAGSETISPLIFLDATEFVLL